MDSNNNHCTWTHNPSQGYTWEIKNNGYDWSKTVTVTSPHNWPNTVANWPNTIISNNTNTIPSITVASTSFQLPRAPTEDDMIEDVMSRTEDRGFFRDMVEWLRKDAPKRLRSILGEFVSPMHTGPVAYDRLCEVLCQIGFRTSELIERRMILGPSNRWVVEYFNDFPPGSRE
jgi:hypothetical protein